MRAHRSLSRRCLILAGAGTVLSRSRTHAASPSLRLRPDEGPPGTTVSARGRTWPPGVEGSITWPGIAEPLATFMADDDGRFEVALTVPDVEPGSEDVLATAAGSSDTDRFSVEPADEGPSTSIASSAPPEATPLAVEIGDVPPQRDVMVSSAAELETALAYALPGDLIRLADGLYPDNFVLRATATEDAPIVVRGSRAAVIDGGDWGASGYAFHLDGCSYVRLSGFSVTNAQKGVMVDNSAQVTIDALEVHTIGHEAIHLRTHTTDSLIAGCDIHDTGLDNEKFGEGVYIGTAVSNWERYTKGEPDASHRNRVIGNRIWAISSECIDIKEGTEDGVVEGNVFDGTAMTGADSWVDVKGSRWTIRGNHGTNSPKDGFQTHVIDNLGWGEENVFEGNTAVVNGPGHGFFIHQPETTRNTVACDNVVEGAGEGMTNLHENCGDHGAATLLS